MNTWKVLFDEEFEREFDDFKENVQDEILVCASVLQEMGPMLGRPRVDTLNGSKHSNMKEFRFRVNKGV